MKFVPDPEVALWLRDFVPDPDNFDWDKGNATKNLKHGFSQPEVESLFLQPQFLFAGQIIEPSHDEWRGLILGRITGGRLVALIFTRCGEKVRPISCRHMRIEERNLYEKTEI